MEELEVDTATVLGAAPAWRTAAGAVGDAGAGAHRALHGAHEAAGHEGVGTAMAAYASAAGRAHDTAAAAMAAIGGLAHEAALGYLRRDDDLAETMRNYVAYREKDA